MRSIIVRLAVVLAVIVFTAFTVAQAQNPAEKTASPEESGDMPENGKQDLAELPRKPAYDSAANLERASLRTRDAVEGLRLYDAFLADPDVAAEEKKLATARLPFWQDSAEKKLIRLGTKWVTAAEKDDLRQEAKNLVSSAWDLVGIGSDDAARDKLVLASRTYPDAIEADFTLGLLNALAARHPATAERHFAACVQRMPYHVSALNNIALAEVRQKKYGQALRHWRTALQIAPGTNEITHNIGRMLRYSGGETIRVPKDVEKGLSDLYVKSTALPGVAKSDESVGWLYMPLFALDDAIIAQDEVEVPPIAGDAQAEDRIVAASSSGVVLGNGIVVTTFQAAQHGDGFQIIHPESLQRVPATLLAVSKPHNLAILRCPTLKSPATTIANAHPRLGTDVMALGFFRGPQGADLRATRGTVGSVANPRNPLCLLAGVDAETDGSPVFDETGALIGVIAADPFETQSNGATAISSRHVIEFIRPHVKDLAFPAANAGAKKWQDVADLGSKSTVLVLIERKPINIAMKNIAVAEERLTVNVYEDRWCIRCNGTDTSECPRAGCALGKILVPRREDGQFKNVRVPCPSCAGRGKVSCPVCDGGIERDLRSSGRRRAR
jgi:tetratricopeptide (TPR) repeat protein